MMRKLLYSITGILFTGVGVYYSYQLSKATVACFTKSFSRVELNHLFFLMAIGFAIVLLSFTAAWFLLKSVLTNSSR